MWFSILWNAITGNLGGIITAITGIFGKMSDNDTTKLTTAIGADKDVAIAQMQAQANAYHDRVDMLKGMWITQWLITAALIPPILHQGLIYLDSVPLFWHAVGSWEVPKAPAPYDEREWSMIASLLGIQTAMTFGLGITRLLLRK